MLLLLLACNGDDTGPTYTPIDTDDYVPWPDSGDTGIDDDGDGWALHEGDCDDDDIYVHPGWEESETEGNHDDGKDNDCDGTTDETFRGLVVLQSGPRDNSANARIVMVDKLGQVDDEIVFDDQAVQNIQYQDLSGTWIDLTFELAPGVFDGWAVLGQDRNTREQILWSVSPSGETSNLVNWADYDSPGYGLDVHPDGFYLVAGLTVLYRVYPNGDVDVVAEFLDTDGETPLMLAFDVSVDPITGQIMVVGYYGGAVLIDPESWEVTWVVTPDLQAPTHNMWSAAFWDTRGGYYAGGQDVDGWAVFRLNEAQGDWVRKASFDESWQPHKMAIDTVYGEYFFSAYGGQNPVIWELDADGGNTSQFFASPHTGPSWMDMWDFYVQY